MGFFLYEFKKNYSRQDYKKSYFLCIDNVQNNIDLNSIENALQSLSSFYKTFNFYKTGDYVCHLSTFGYYIFLCTQKNHNDILKDFQDYGISVTVYNYNEMIDYVSSMDDWLIEHGSRSLYNNYFKVYINNREYYDDKLWPKFDDTYYADDDEYNEEIFKESPLDKEINGNFTILANNENKIKKKTKSTAITNTKVNRTKTSNKKQVADNNSNKNITKKLSLNKVKSFVDFFKDRVIGQDDVLNEINDHLIQLSYGITDQNRPAGIFFFAGPTGVGKTETCKALNEFLYNHDNINRFDMSEYKNEVSINKLIGADHGFVGFEEGGILVNVMKKNPNSIILFDEIEKAHNLVFDLFLQLLDEGYITSNQGEKISFKNNIIIFTSNIGANKIKSDFSYEKVCKIVKEDIDNYFSNVLNRPELLGRIGKENILVFNLISSKNDLYKILDIQFCKLLDFFNKNNTSLSFDKEKVYDEILCDVDTTKGARDVRNEFDQFKKRFTKALFENNLTNQIIKKKQISFRYEQKKVLIDSVN